MIEIVGSLGMNIPIFLGRLDVLLNVLQQSSFALGPYQELSGLVEFPCFQQLVEVLKLLGIPLFSSEQTAANLGVRIGVKTLSNLV